MKLQVPHIHVLRFLAQREKVTYAAVLEDFQANVNIIGNPARDACNGLVLDMIASGLIDCSYAGDRFPRPIDEVWITKDGRAALSFPDAPKG